jgi:iron-regulated transporter 1
MAVEEPEIDAGSAHNSPGDVYIENASLIPRSETALNIEPNGMTRPQAFNLYTSHLLSTWNIRTYEFAAVSGDWELENGGADSCQIIFTAAAYPDTLVAAAIR